MTPIVDGSVVVAALEAAGFTHVVWVPDSHIGMWEPAILASRLTLIRACREGEAVGLAVGLMLGDAVPAVVIQCTGFFEAGDAIRNAVHDLGLPLKMIVGIRSMMAHIERRTTDNCPRYAEPLAAAWDIQSHPVDPFSTSPNKFARRVLSFRTTSDAQILFLAE